MLNKMREVFTKEYREETEYIEFFKKMMSRIRLKNQSESIEEKVKRLSDSGFVSDFQIEIGEFR